MQIWRNVACVWVGLRSLCNDSRRQGTCEGVRGSRLRLCTDPRKAHMQYASCPIAQIV